jgi:hypothetical protein
VLVFESLFGMHDPNGFEVGSHNRRLSQNVGNSSKFATELPLWVGVGSVAGSLNLHFRWLAEPGVDEKNFIAGSA